MNSETAGTAPGSRIEKAIVFAIISLFAVVSFFAARPKAPSADTLIHYGFGQEILGAPFGGSIQYARHGTSPFTALFVLSCEFRQWLTPLLGPPRDPFTFPGLTVTLPSIFWSYLPVLVLAMIGLYILWAWLRPRLGRTAAFSALLLMALEPNYMAHSHYATTDMASTFGFLLGSVAAGWYAERPSIRRGILMAFALAVAQVLKLPNILLYPAAGLIVLYHEWSARRAQGLSFDIRGLVRRHAVTLLVFIPVAYLAMLQIAYAGFIDHHSFHAMISKSPHKDLLEHYGGAWYRLYPVIPALYSYTIAYAKFFNAQGNWSYLAGHYSQFGWWYYYPVAVALKTPLPILACGAAGVYVLFRNAATRRALAPLVLPAVLYVLYFCVFVHGNVGVRHVLPAYPAMFALGGAAMSCWSARLSAWRKYLPQAAVAAWLVVISAVIFPHYEEYFNLAAGGSNNGWKWLGDSNIDFGQEQFYAEKWARRQKVPVSSDPMKPVTGKIIIRATLLIGHTREMTSETAWLREHYKPVEQPTPALLVFDVPVSDVSHAARNTKEKK